MTSLEDSPLKLGFVKGPFAQSKFDDMNVKKKVNLLDIRVLKGRL